MKKTKKVITMLMLDGNASGCTKVELKNWTGIAYKVVRDRLDAYIDREDFQKNGVYFLFGDGAVYIGQAGVRQNAASGIAARLTEHTKNPQKEFWEEAVFFVTKEDDFGATDLNFLENRFYTMAKEANSYKIENKVSPNPGNTTEAKEAELEEFSDNAELILGLLGYKVFEKQAEKPVIVLPSQSVVPPLPDMSLKVGEFVRTAMINLAESGYIFSNEDINKMTTKEWGLANLRIGYGFFKLYKGKETTNRDDKGYVRFWTNVFTFGNVDVLISSQWFDPPHGNANRDKFIAWYKSLG